ncbi:molecular chaperone [Enterobacter sp. E76]|nr:molecular chaperone [Enterobacter sp. E76]
MKMFSRALAAILLMSAAVSGAQAGVIIGGTRVVYQGNKKEVPLSVNNPDKLAYLIQSWIDAPTPDAAKAPFIITPPLYRLDAGQQNEMRIIRAGQLAENKESLFWLNIKSIPSVAKRDNTIQIAVKTRIKLIYRPESLTSTPEEQAAKLQWSRAGNSIQVNNPTPYYINFNEIAVGGKRVEDATFVAPQSSARFALPPGVNSTAVNFKIINDYGGIGDSHSVSLR